jgi:hypothetical protein
VQCITTLGVDRFSVNVRMGNIASMKMARTMTLVLLGGGVVLGGASLLGGGSDNRDRRRECQEARATNPAKAQQICASAGSSSTSGGGGRSWFFGRTGTSADPAVAGASGLQGDSSGTSSRGGFGSTSRGFTSSGG